MTYQTECLYCIRGIIPFPKISESHHWVNESSKSDVVIMCTLSPSRTNRALFSLLIKEDKTSVVLSLAANVKI